MKAIFMVTWVNGTPQMPEGFKVDGTSMYKASLTNNGRITAMITADPKVIEQLKDHLEFVGYPPEEEL